VCRLEDNIKMGLKEQEETVDLINVAQNTNKWRSVVHRVMNFRFPRNSANFSIS